MQRLWLRWIALAVFVAVLGTTFVLLGRWQLNRLAERQANNAVVVLHEAEPIVDYRQVFTRPILDADQWQRVSVTGMFDTGHQFIVRYRSVNDGPGTEVVTPLRTDAGDLILVDRGFIPRDKGQPTPTTAPAAPSGKVTIIGHVRRNEQGKPVATDPVDSQMRLINSDAVSRVLGEPLLNGYIGLITVEPNQESDLRAIPLPSLDEGPHFWYAMQWFTFTVIAVVGLVVFVRGDIKQRRAQRLETAANVAEEGT